MLFSQSDDDDPSDLCPLGWTYVASVETCYQPRSGLVLLLNDLPNLIEACDGQGHVAAIASNAEREAIAGTWSSAMWRWERAMDHERIEF